MAMLVASHANPRRIMMDGRQLPDFAIKAIAERDGVVGVMPAAWALPANTLDAVCDAIEAVAEVAGERTPRRDRLRLRRRFRLRADAGRTRHDRRPRADRRGARGARLVGATTSPACMGGNWLRVLGGLYA